MVNKTKGLVIVPSQIGAGLRQLTRLDVCEDEAFFLLYKRLDPKGYGELTFSMLKKHWLPEWKAASETAQEQLAKTKAMHYTKRFLAHPSVESKNKVFFCSNPASGLYLVAWGGICVSALFFWSLSQGASMVGAVVVRSTGGWGNRGTRRKAQVCAH